MKKKEVKPDPDAPREEPYHPMAVPEPSTEDRLEALELRMKEMEKVVTKHNMYHFGGTTGGMK